MSNDKPTPSAEPSNGGAKPGQHTLTAEQRLAINDHLVQVVSSWAKWLGIANVAYLVTSLGYVFFVLPNQAVVEAQKIMEAHIDAQTTLINQKMHTILESYGQATERYEALNKQAV